MTSLHSQLQQLAHAKRKAERKPTSQDMEKKKLRMREYYRNNREAILKRMSPYNKARYTAMKKEQENEG